MIGNILLAVKGFIMGIANLIPGVSGGTIALTLGIYEQFIHALGHFKSDFKKNIAFLIPVIIGLIASLLGMSNVIEYAFEQFPLYTTLFFTGLVIGGIPAISKQAKPFARDNISLSNTTVFLGTFSLVILMALLEGTSGSGGAMLELNIPNGAMLIAMGAVVAATMILPGVSGSLLLMLFGFYDTIIGALAGLGSADNFAYNISVILLYGVGIIIGLIGMARIVEFLFKKFRQKTLFGVLGFICASVLSVPLVALDSIVLSFNVTTIIISVLFATVGFAVSYILGRNSAE